MIELSNTRFIRIDGTAVHLLAASDAEARIALKELRHKKREISHLRRRLRLHAKAAGARTGRRRRPAAHASADPATTPGSNTPPGSNSGASNSGASNTGINPDMSAPAFIARSLAAVVDLATGWNPFRRAPLPTTPLPTTPDALQADLATLEELTLNLDSAILHVQAKLLGR